MKQFSILLFFAAFFWAEAPRAYSASSGRELDSIPFSLPADFKDDYGIRYTISDTLWIQHPSTYYHIIRWNKLEQYVIAKNGTSNKTEPGLYTRIDYVRLDSMDPWRWGFCLSTYDAKTDSLAEFSPTKTDKLNPKKGCNGFPFSRMRKAGE